MVGIEQFMGKAGRLLHWAPRPHGMLLYGFVHLGLWDPAYTRAGGSYEEEKAMDFIELVVKPPRAAMLVGTPLSLLVPKLSCLLTAKGSSVGWKGLN